MDLLSKKTWMVLVALTLVSAVSHAADDDELMNILGNGAAPTAHKSKKEEVSDVRKLLKSPTGEQTIFISHFDKGDFEKALFAFPSAFTDTAFGKSANGKALFSFLLYKNGMKVAGLESLLAIEKPHDIAPALAKMWTEAAPVNDQAWSLVQVPNWNPKFTDIFGTAVEIRVRARKIYGTDQIATLKELIKKTQADTPERAWLSWQLVLALSTGDDAGTAAKALAVLMKAPNNPISQDLMTVTAARLLFQNGFLDAAIKYYGQVPKASDYWFEAQEEQAWSYIRKGEPQNAIAITKSLARPEFTSQIGPEPMFLHSLSELKVCDYPAVVATLNEFRDRFRTRAKDLMAISETSENKDVDNFIARAQKENMTFEKLGAAAAKLPRFITRDEVLKQAVASQVALDNEANIASGLFGRAVQDPAAQPRSQAQLGEFNKAATARAAAAHATARGRAVTLAAEEVAEISAILQKFHIVEAEVLEQLSISNTLADANPKTGAREGTTGSHAKDRLLFPAEQEIWFDELTNYKVDIKKGCRSAKR